MIHRSRTALMSKAVLFVLALFVLTYGPTGLAQSDGRLNIQVQDETGAAVPGAEIRLRPMSKSRSTRLMTNEIGQATVTLRAGLYAVFAAAPEFKTFSKTVSVTPGGTESLTIALKVVSQAYSGPVVEPIPSARQDRELPTPVSVQLQVKDENGTPVAFARVTYWDKASSSWKEFESDDQGRVEMKLIPGKYEFHLACLSFKDSTKTVDVKDGMSPIDVVLTEAPVE